MALPFRLREWPGVLGPADDEPPQLDAPTTRSSRRGAVALKIFPRAVRDGRYSDVVLSFTVLAIISSFVGHSFMLSPYNKHVMDDISLTKTELSSIWAITLIASAGWLNVVGIICDRVGAQPVIFCGGIAVAVALVTFANAQGVGGIMVSYTLIRLSSVETVDFSVKQCLNHWFVERAGFAAGVLNSVSSIGFFLPAVETLAVDKFGWRATAVGFGVSCGSMILLCSVFLLSRPEDYGLRPDMSRWSSAASSRGTSPLLTAKRSDDDFTLKEAVRTPVFWTLIGAWMCSTLPWAGINFWLVSILDGANHTQKDAVFVYLPLSFVSAAAAAAAGVIVDKIPAGKKHFSIAMVSGGMLIAVVAGAFLDRLPGPTGPLLLGSGLGIWEGTGNVVSTTIVPSLFGRKHLGSIRGLFMASAQISSAVAPLVMALALDNGVSFRFVCCILSCCQAFAILVICIVPPPKKRSDPEIKNLLGTPVDPA